MDTEFVGDYLDWAHIDYRPPTHMLPKVLLRYLPKQAKILDIGCNTGTVACFLGQQGFKVHGVDINPTAIREAEEKVQETGLVDLISLSQGDILELMKLPTFDAVLLIRVLTCFAEASSWRRLVQRSHSLVSEGGLIYVRDFILDCENALYQQRYREWKKRGKRPGNFLVLSPAEKPLFFAHHHSLEEIEGIKDLYEEVLLHDVPALSMNGNPCTSFEFIGRKRARTRTGHHRPPAHRLPNSYTCD